MKPNKAKGFDALQKQWYKKLKDSGFEDIEQDETFLKSNLSSSISKRLSDEISANATLNYSRLAGFFLHEHEFDSEFERLVWDGHAQGKSVREITHYIKNIAPKLKTMFLNKQDKTNFTGVYRDRVNVIIVKLRKIMLEKYANEGLSND